jgi:hypothetical protein
MLVGGCADDGEPDGDATDETRAVGDDAESTTTTAEPGDDTTSSTAGDPPETTATTAPRDTAADQEIADSAVLTATDMPDWEATPADDDGDEEGDGWEQLVADCPEVADIADLSDVDDIDAMEASSAEFEREGDGALQFFAHEVAVLPSPDEITRVLDVMASPEMGDCLERLVMGDESAAPGEGYDVSAIEASRPDLGDEAVLLEFDATTSMEGQPLGLGFAMLMVRVDRSVAMFTGGGMLMDDAAFEPLPADRRLPADAVDLVIERLEAALG